MKKEYKIDFTNRAKRELSKFRKKHRKSYSEFLILLPALALDPYGIGEPLKGKLKGLFALHFGRKPECRALYEIKNNEIIVLIVKVGTRENFYDY